MLLYLGGTVVGIKLTEIEENTRIIFHIYHGEQQMDLGGVLKKHLENNIALISLDYTGSQTLVFENVVIDMEYPQKDGIPLLWSNVKIVSYKNSYIMQATIDGARNNRRSSFRLSVGKKAWFTMHGRDPQYVMLKDISVSGFSISDRKRELNLKKGNMLTVTFEDAGYRLELAGRVVRIEERDDMVVYGMSITNICNDLSAYINVKQRPTKR